MLSADEKTGWADGADAKTKENASADSVNAEDNGAETRVVSDRKILEDLVSGNNSEGKESEKRGFVFGSYGRVQPATDLRGGMAKWANIVGHGSRLEQESYAELDFVYLFKRPDKDGPLFDFVSTIAFSESLFHNSGKWIALNTVRNLFVRAENLGWKPLGMWIGSRMYRGDDIYLLDFWPLDDANLYGGGNYGRPQLRLLYTAAFQNDDARFSYNRDDFRSKHSVLHYFGLSAEWWFNTEYR